MAHPQTRAQFIDYCKRRLGHPVIEINVDDDQVDDRVDEALQFWRDYHYDGAEKIFLKHQITQQDRDRRYILIPDRIHGVTGVLDFDGSSASVNMFDLRYQLRLHDLYDFTSISYVPYTITMQHLRTLNILFSGSPQMRFHRHKNRLMLDVNWDGNLAVGTYILIECYGDINADRINLTGTITLTGSSNTVSGSGTSFDAEVIKDDAVTFVTANATYTTTVTGIHSNTGMNVSTTWATSEAVTSAYLEANSDVWNDRVLKELGVLFMKRQWGENLKKFGGVQMPGGLTLNGQQIYDEAINEIERLRQEFITYNTLPNDFMIG